VSLRAQLGPHIKLTKEENRVQEGIASGWARDIISRPQLTWEKRGDGGGFGAHERRNGRRGLDAGTGPRMTDLSNEAEKDNHTKGAMYYSQLSSQRVERSVDRHSQNAPVVCILLILVTWISETCACNPKGGEWRDCILHFHRHKRIRGFVRTAHHRSCSCLCILAYF
jgi:hypothetical protein